MTDIRASIDDEGGRYRAVAEVDVPGTPEQVWELIATGPGLETWFVPAEVDPGPGGRIVTHHGSYGASEGTITAWDPPRRLVFDEPEEMGPDRGTRTWNTEILVEARSGDTCVVRLTSGFLVGGDEWRDDVDQTLGGWTAALRTMRLYLTHFAGLAVTTLLVQHEVPGSVDVPDVVDAAGLRTGKVGDEVATSASAPSLSGVVEQIDDTSVTVRTHEPPGIAEVAGMRYGGTSSVMVRWYLYGEQGPTVRDRERQAWAAWAGRLTGTTTG
ncbi:SRPBCC family protein [Micromonospora echinospora]|uniref:SRPBCC family protein n=1 Tax=Micromonospora echinospora TaxID=1877 RepID=UPI003A846868